jgi:prepilin-type N-terminal cleavage/methylation domain-containing protein
MRLLGPKSQGGVTLIELMISVAIFAISIVALLDVFAQGQKMAYREEYAYTSFNIAKNRIETLKSISFSDLSASAETLTALGADGLPDPDGIYKRTTTVTPSYSGDANLTQVTVQVYYVFKGIVNTLPIQLSTVIYNGS